MLGYFPNLPYHVVVIGAASGIGRETASFLATQGVSVACIDRNLAGADETAATIASGQGKAFSAAADVTEDASIPPALDAAERALGPIDGVVNCAGVTGKTNLKGHEVDLADFDGRLPDQPAGAMVLSKAVLPRMLARNYGASPCRLDRRQGGQRRHGRLCGHEGRL